VRAYHAARIVGNLLVTRLIVSIGRMVEDLRLSPGTGSIVFSDYAAGSRGSIRVFYFRPPITRTDPPVVIAMHGFDRAASDFLNVWLEPADRLGLFVLVPEFDVEAFPDAHSYNYGNVRRLPPDNVLNSRNFWNFGIIDRLFAKVKAATRSSRECFLMFGNSAGAQYVLRYLALTEAPFVKMAIAANSGWYMLPDFALDYPAGMGGLDIEENSLHRYLQRNIVVLLGDADTDVAASDLPRNEEARIQGSHRFARGLWHFEHRRTVAERIAVPFGWRLEILAGAGHVDQILFDHSANLLADAKL
jgi:poly(3-hydroxybutyrate) depolymerase